MSHAQLSLSLALFTPAITFASLVPFIPTTTVTDAVGSAAEIKAADIDGDLNPDVVWVDSGGGTVNWLESTDGLGGSWTNHVVATGVSGVLTVDVADADRDGDLDILVAAGSFGQALWYENLNGLGTSWAAMVIDSQADGIGSARFGDVDGDGSIDVFVVARYSALVWWENVLGDGSVWSEHTIAAIPGDLANSVPADLDGDGDLDLVVAERFALGVYWWKNLDGVGGSWSSTDIDNSLESPSGLDVGDIDEDGDLDVVATEYTTEGALVVLTNTAASGNGSIWSTNAIDSFLYPTAVKIGDLDHDGDPDLALTTGGPTVLWCDNTAGNATQWLPTAVDFPGDSPVGIDVADLDTDGDLDLLVGQDVENYTWYENASLHVTRVFGTSQTLVSSFTYAMSGIPADVDGDGDQDVVAAAEGLDEIAWFDNTAGNGTAWTTRVVNLSTQSDGPFAVWPGDIDGDGDIDIASVHQVGQEVSWWENTAGTGLLWTEHSLATARPNLLFVRVVDFDRDGDQDLLYNYNASVVHWIDNTSGTMSSFVDRSATGPISGLRMEYPIDLDSDGDLDLVVAGSSANKVFWYESNGASPPTFTQRTIDNSFTHAYETAAGDFDSDGDIDVVCASQNGNSVRWYANSGTNLSWTPTTLTTNLPGARHPEAADLDLDGDLDIAVSGYLGGIRWWQNDGAGTFTEASITTTGSYWVQGADLNDDGSLDLIGNHHDAGTVKYYTPSASYHFNVTTASMGLSAILPGSRDAMLSFDVDSLGRPTDGPLELASIQLYFDTGTAEYSDTDMDNVLDAVEIWRDNGDGIYSASSDSLVLSNTAMTVSSGYLSLVIPDNTPAAQAVYNGPVFFVVVVMDPNCASSGMTTLRVTENSQIISFEEWYTDSPTLSILGYTSASAWIPVIPPDADGDGDPDLTDCNDADATIHAGAAETCDTIDTNCDGSLIDGFTNTDGDGQPNCVDTDDDNDLDPDTTDCNDGDPAIYSAAPESCDLIDSDCDGSLVDTFLDTDEDEQPDCVDPDDDGDADPDSSDCDDTNDTIHAGAVESCDLVDSDCDGSLVDNFPNTDGDAQPDCVDADDDNDLDPDTTDCDDSNATIYSGASEFCDVVDSDCDGSLVDTFADTDQDAQPDCIDTDDDGDADPDNSDCDDTNASVYSGALESCDLIDSDCNGSLVDTFPDTDEDAQPDCIDTDDDGDADPDTTDCDDGDATIYNGAPESCDLVDGDCDGSLVDTFTNSDTDGNPDCIDLDDDDDLDPDTTDCDDTNASIYSGAPESCDLVDGDCDDSLVDTFLNTDEDSEPDCVDSDDDSDEDPDTTDCEDLDALFHASAAESCDLVDNDCDADLVDGFANTDGDGEPDCVDLDDDNDLDPDTSDCHSGDDSIFTDAPEFCDNVDSDCDGDLVDDDDNTDGDQEPDCIDEDDDGDLDPDTTDCDTMDATIFAGAPESCDQIDSDCDLGLADEFADTDSDGLPDCVDGDADQDGDPDLSDCAPFDDAYFAGAVETFDLVDSDCDGSLVDEFVNTDGDGEPDCVDADDDSDADPDASDCASEDATIFNLAPESCDLIDSDCDGDFVDGGLDTNSDGEPDCTDSDDDGDEDPDTTDCDDLDGTVFAGATESCDLIDSSCDSDLVDSFPNTDGDDEPDCTDVDDDGDGDPDSTDCNDANDSIFGNAPEVCDTIDSDCDGDLADAFADLDGDGLPACEDADDDGDGLADAWETAHGLDASDPTTTDQDPDLDGRSNEAEFDADTDPNEFDGPGAPTLLFPGDGVAVGQLQPALRVGNTSSPLGLTLTYVFEVYGDAELANLAAEADSVAEGGGGQTGWSVSTALGENQRWWWRAAAWDGVVQGPWSALWDFVVDEVAESPGQTVFNSPLDGDEIVATRPVFRCTEATDPEGGALLHHLEVDTSPAFDSPPTVVEVWGEGDGNDLRFELPTALIENTEYHARVWAIDGDGNEGPGDEISFFVRGLNDAPPVPELLAPEAGGTWDGEDGFVVGNVADAEGDAVSYDFVLALDPGLESIVVLESAVAEGVEGTSSAFLSPPVGGTLYWSARARDEHGAASAWAEPRAVEVEAANGCQSGGASLFLVFPLGFGLRIRPRRGDRPAISIASSR